jgi:hypothetical protein
MTTLKPERFVLEWSQKQDRQDFAWPVRPRAGGVSQRSEAEGGKLYRYNEFLSNGFFFAAAPLPAGEGDGRYLPKKYVDQKMLCYELSVALREGQ